MSFPWLWRQASFLAVSSAEKAIGGPTEITASTSAAMVVERAFMGFYFNKLYYVNLANYGSATMLIQSLVDSGFASYP